MSVVGAALRGFGRALKRKGKVSPTIKSVKPNLKKTVKESKTDEYRRRYTALDKADDKVKKGREMMRAGQKERRRMVDTKRAFQFRHTKSYHAIDPRNSKQYADSMRKPKPQPRFKKGKELNREPKAAGGLMIAKGMKSLMEQLKKTRKERRMGAGARDTKSKQDKISEFKRRLLDRAQRGQPPKKQKPSPSPRKPRPKKYPPKRIMTPLARGGRSFPDLSGDGKVTKKDILMGRGVIKKRRPEKEEPMKKND
jgi:hypothetical protein